MFKPLFEGHLERCHFCEQKWGNCNCFEDAVDEHRVMKPDAPHFVWNEMLICRPNVSECTRFFVHPETCYGPAYTNSKLYVRPEDTRFAMLVMYDGIIIRGPRQRHLTMRAFHDAIYVVKMLHDGRLLVWKDRYGGSRRIISHAEMEVEADKHLESLSNLRIIEGIVPLSEVQVPRSLR